ncbi:MAG: hypothetical protein PHX86_06325 [Caldisericia bacterium]|nr:hypothetical protein [Caldisericia bacterium]
MSKVILPSGKYSSILRDEGRRHVDGKVFDPVGAASVPFEKILKGFKNVFDLAFRHEDGAFALEVNEGRDIVLAKLSGRLIEPHGGDLRKVLLLDGLVDVMMGDPPDSRVPLVENSSR